MGATPSKTEILNEIINDVSSKTQSTCSTNSSNLQTISISGLTVNGCKNAIISNISQVTNSSVNAKCYQSNQFKTLLENEFNSKLNSINNVENSDLTMLKNSLKNNIAVENISSCMASQVNTQGMKFDNITVNCPLGGEFRIQDISQTITSQLLSDCVQKNITDYANAKQTEQPSQPDSTESNEENKKEPQSNENTNMYIGFGIFGIFLLLIIMILIITLVIKK